MRSFFSQENAATRRNVSDRLLMLRYRPNHLRNYRVAVVVGKALGNAVARNRARRRIREAYRQVRYRAQSGYDLVFVARAPAITARFNEIQKSIITLMQRSRLFHETHESSG